jgi:hypothetical protein
LASRHDEFLEAGTRITAVSVDSVGQQAAILDMLDLPFPLLTDPDRSSAIEPFGVADPRDPREIAVPAMILVDTDGNETFRFVSRDYADRIPEDEVLEKVRALGLGPTTQAAPSPGTPQPGERAMPLDGLPYYLRGARFAVAAFGFRHKDLDESLKEDSKAYVEEMERYLEAVQALRKRLAAD